MSNSTSSSKGSSPPPPPSKSSSPPSESDSPPPPPKSNSPPPSPPSSNSPPTGSKDSHSPPPPNSSPPPDDDNSPPPPSKSNSPPPPSQPPPPPPQSTPPPPPQITPPPQSTTPPPPQITPPPQSTTPPPPQNTPPPQSTTPPPSQSTPPPPNNQAPPTLNLSPPANDPPPPPPPPTDELQPPPSPDSPPASGSSTTSRTPPRRNSPPNSSTPSGSATNTDSPKHQSPSSDSSSANTRPIIGLVVAGVIFVLILTLCMVLILTRKRKRPTLDYRAPPTISVQADGNYYRPANLMGYSGQSDSYISQGHSGPASGIMGGSNRNGYSGQMEPGGGKSWFNYEELMEVTSGFSRENMIGEGGFGCVYKGTLADGRRVAVKNLKAGSGQGEREFRAEVEIISRVHHRHLVSLVGYCVAEDHRLLVYEFLPNNTLEHHLHGTPVMDWPKRMRIAIGSAKGLAYLHEDCHPRIIHRDIKSANILLEDTFEPQVADFGLAKLSNDTHTHVSTRVMGTFGYMAPEYASSGKLTDRSDVFSFGVVLLEIITGRKPVDTSRPLGDESLVEWARPLLVRALETGNCDDLVDPRLDGNYNKTEMFNMIEAAAACVRHSAPRRPRMVQVVRALDSRDDMPDLSNGVKYGQSRAFNPGPPTADIQRFRRMAFGSSENNSFDSDEYDRRSAVAFSGEFRSREHKQARRAADQGSGEFESDTRAMFRAEKSTSGRNYRRGFA